MFCMECGAKLPDSAKFCMNCGTPTGQTAAMPAASAKKSALVAEKPVVTGYNSEKRQRMAYISDTGLFFTDGKQLSFLPKGEKKIKNVVRSSSKLTHIYKLASHDKTLYYWEYRKEQHTRLMKIDPITLKKELVCAYEWFDISDYNMHFWGDSYYHMDPYKDRICRICVKDGSVTNMETPDLRKGMIPEDWKEPTGYLTIDEKTAQEKSYTYSEHKYHCIKVLNGYGILDLLVGYPCATIFPLDDPDDFICLPLDCGIVGCGMMTFVGDTLYSGGDGLRSIGFWKTENGSSKMLLDLKKKDLDHSGMDEWWKTSSCIFTKEFYYDIQAEKFIRMPKIFFDSISDSVMDEKGGAYVDSGSGIYYFPDGWEKDSKEKERDVYLLAELDI